MAEAFHSLDQDADRALFSGKIHALVAAFYQNERPLGGLAGLLDWRFHGIISQYVRAGAIRGEPGHCSYFPLSRNGQTLHILFAGAGHNAGNGSRNPLPQETLKALQKNLLSLRLQKIGVSRKDLGDVTNDFLHKNLKGVPLWIAP